MESNTITTQQRQDAIRAMVDMHGQRLGLPAPIRTTAIFLALSTYRADPASAWRAVEDGRYLLDEVHEGYELLDGLEVRGKEEIDERRGGGGSR